MSTQTKVPRLDKYDALVHRLFEILILSDILKKGTRVALNREP